MNRRLISGCLPAIPILLIVAFEVVRAVSEALGWR